MKLSIQFESAEELHRVTRFDTFPGVITLEVRDVRRTTGRSHHKMAEQTLKNATFHSPQQAAAVRASESRQKKVPSARRAFAAWTNKKKSRLPRGYAALIALIRGATKKTREWLILMGNNKDALTDEPIPCNTAFLAKRLHASPRGVTSRMGAFSKYSQGNFKVSTVYTTRETKEEGVTFTATKLLCRVVEDLQAAPSEAGAGKD